MNSLDKRLKAVGYNVKTRPASCWQVQRIGPPVGARSRRTGATRSRALSWWLDRLCDCAPSAVYRIGLAGDPK